MLTSPPSGLVLKLRPLLHKYEAHFFNGHDHDLEHIKGDQIVAGNPEHCINLLQLAKEISCMMNSNSNELDANQLQGEDDEDEEGDSGVDYENQADLNEMQQ